MIVNRLAYMTPVRLLQIANLIQDNDEVDVVQYVEYLRGYIRTDDIFVVVIMDERLNIAGIVHAEAPHPIFPKQGYTMFAYLRPDVPRKDADQALKMMEDWYKKMGCSHYIMHTRRSPRALERLYGMHKTDEVVMRKDIDG